VTEVSKSKDCLSRSQDYVTEVSKSKYLFFGFESVFFTTDLINSFCHF
jgi:hypothetical protein